MDDLHSCPICQLRIPKTIEQIRDHVNKNHQNYNNKPFYCEYCPNRHRLSRFYCYLRHLFNVHGFVMDHSHQPHSELSSNGTVNSVSEETNKHPVVNGHLQSESLINHQQCSTPESGTIHLNPNEHYDLLSIMDNQQIVPETTKQSKVKIRNRSKMKNGFISSKKKYNNSHQMTEIFQQLTMIDPKIPSIFRKEDIDYEAFMLLNISILKHMGFSYGLITKILNVQQRFVRGNLIQKSQPASTTTNNTPEVNNESINNNGLANIKQDDSSSALDHNLDSTLFTQTHSQPVSPTENHDLVYGGSMFDHDHHHDHHHGDDISNVNHDHDQSNHLSDYPNDEFNHNGGAMPSDFLLQQMVPSEIRFNEWCSMAQNEFDLKRMFMNQTEFLFNKNGPEILEKLINDPSGQLNVSDLREVNRIVCEWIVKNFGLAPSGSVMAAIAEQIETQFPQLGPAQGWYKAPESGFDGTTGRIYWRLNNLRKINRNQRMKPWRLNPPNGRVDGSGSSRRGRKKRRP